MIATVHQLRRGQRPCKHCGQEALDHMLAMTEKRCRDGSGRRFEAEQVRRSRRAISTRAFDAEEAAAMKQLFRALYAGGDVRQLLKRAAVVSVVSKFETLHESFTGEK